jgi:hypothetical protein
MNTIKHLYHFFLTHQYRSALLFGFVIGFSDWEIRRVIFAQVASKMLRQNIVNANGYSGLMVPNLQSLRDLCDEAIWMNHIEPRYFEEKERLNKWWVELKAGKIVVMNADFG